MAIKRVTYVAGSASIIRLPDRTEVLLDIVPTAVRMRKLGALGRPGDTLWEHRFPTEVGDGSPLARQALDVALIARGTGGLEGVQFHYKWGPGWSPFAYTGTAFSK